MMLFIDHLMFFHSFQIKLLVSFWWSGIKPPHSQEIKLGQTHTHTHTYTGEMSGGDGGPAATRGWRVLKETNMKSQVNVMCSNVCLLAVWSRCERVIHPSMHGCIHPLLRYIVTEKPSYLQTYAINAHYRWKNAKKKKKVFFQSKSRPLTLKVIFKVGQSKKVDWE